MTEKINYEMREVGWGTLLFRLSELLRNYVKLLRTLFNLKNAVFWDVTPYRSCVNRRFGGTYRLHLQGRKIC
jgi:hypothetical protein